MNTVDIIGAANKKFPKLYHLGNLEVRSSYARIKWYMVLSPNMPLRRIRIVAWGDDQLFKNFKELEFDFPAVEIVVRITELALNSCPLQTALLRGPLHLPLMATTYWRRYWEVRVTADHTTSHIGTAPHLVYRSPLLLG